MSKKRCSKAAQRAAQTVAQQITVALGPEDEVQRRRELLRDRYPHLFARVCILGKLMALQEARGGEFEPKYVFVHMPDYILNIRRVGKIDLLAAVVPFEVYEHNDIVPGIIYVPLDHIWWVGTTDEPCGVEQLGLRAKEGRALPPDAAYQQARLNLAGLPPRP